MKAKLQIHVEVIPSQTIPGKFNLATQYTDGGAITTNDNGGQGFTEEAATEEARKIRGEATPQTWSLLDCCPPGHTLLEFGGTIQIQKDKRTVAEVPKPYDRQTREWWTNYFLEAIAGKP